MLGSITRVGPVFGSPIWNPYTTVSEGGLDDCCEEVLAKLELICDKIEDLELTVSNSITTINQSANDNFDFLCKLIKRIFSDQRDHKQLIEVLSKQISSLNKGTGPQNGINPRGGRYDADRFN